MKKDARLLPEGAAAEAKQQPQQQQQQQQQQQSELYFHREVLAYSVQGRRVDILTVTSQPRRAGTRSSGGGSDGAPKSEFESMKAFTRQHPVAFPERRGKGGKSTACWRFNGKPIILVSARVHPGETPASFSFDGLLDFLVDAQDPRAARLRELFVFKLIPMLNPDGVALGHYRANTFGVNLNRVYHSPDAAQHPSIAAVSALLTFYSVLAPWTSLFLYLDMHAHANKRGCFLFGNYVEETDQQVENVCYSTLVSLNTPYLDLDACDFSKRNMAARDKKDASVSKEGSGRVAVFKATGVPRCYTLECNYNSGKVLGATSKATLLPQTSSSSSNNGSSSSTKHNLRARASGPAPAASRPVRAPSPERNPGALALSPQAVKYDPAVWRDVGKACAVAVLDLVGHNPWSRVEHSPFKSLSGVKMQVQHQLRASRAKAKKKSAAKRAKRAAIQRREQQQALLHFPAIF